MAIGERKKGRRPAGDGSVYKAPDGRWRGVVDLGWVDGKRRRKYVTGPTQAQALDKLRQAQRVAAAGVVTDDRITVGAFLERWVTVNMPGTVANGTLDDYAERSPDFTIEDATTGVTIYWEHLGLLRRPSYRRKWEEKLAWYRRNGILPYAEGGGTNGTLVTTEDGDDGSISSSDIEALVDELLG